MYCAENGPHTGTRFIWEESFKKEPGQARICTVLPPERVQRHRLKGRCCYIGRARRHDPGPGLREAPSHWRRLSRREAVAKIGFCSWVDAPACIAYTRAVSAATSSSVGLPFTTRSSGAGLCCVASSACWCTTGAAVPAASGPPGSPCSVLPAAAVSGSVLGVESDAPSYFFLPNEK